MDSNWESHKNTISGMPGHMLMAFQSQQIGRFIRLISYSQLRNQADMFGMVSPKPNHHIMWRFSVFDCAVCWFTTTWSIGFMAFWGLLWAVKTNKHGIHAIICRVRSAYRSLEFTGRPLIQHDPTSSGEIIQSILSSGGVVLPNCELTLEDARKMTTLDYSLTPNHIQQM